MQTMTDFVFRAAESLQTAFYGLLVPALFFFAIGYFVKRKSLFSDMHKAARESGLNILLFAFNVVFVVPLITFLSVFFYDVAKSIGLPQVGGALWQGLTPVLVIFIAIFWGDFVGYWRHRFEHSALLWPSHAVHHSDTEMTWLTLERFHPINRLTTFLIDSLALMVLGFPPYAIAANNLVRHYYGYFIHADLPWTYGKWSALFVSPVMHRWHHAADVLAFNTNYATVFSIFDRVFGTYRVPGLCNVRLGVTDKMAPTLAGQLGYAFTRRAYARLRIFRKRKEPGGGENNKG